MNIDIDFNGLWELAIFITLILVAFRVSNLISWSMWWVLSPCLFVGGLELIVLLGAMIAFHFFSKKQ